MGRSCRKLVCQVGKVTFFCVAAKAANQWQMPAFHNHMFKIAVKLAADALKQKKRKKVIK